jgi:hypothetical protein
MKITIIRKAEVKSTRVAACPWVVEMLADSKNK